MCINRTQELIWRAFRESSYSESELLLEALLRRGFLAFQDPDGLWLGTGSTQADASVLQLVPGLASVIVPKHRDRYCEISVVETDPYPLTDIAKAIIFLGEHHVGSEYGGFSSFGFGYGGITNFTWPNYLRISWGPKVSVCPARTLLQSPVQDALDTGIALLVKSLALTGVATSLSCDGHGVKAAYISFCFPWDSAWGETVFGALPFKPSHSIWDWDSTLNIHPTNGFDDYSVTNMLEDIQQWSRQILNNDVIGKISVARWKTIHKFSIRGPGPTTEEFRAEASKQIGLLS